MTPESNEETEDRPTLGGPTDLGDNDQMPGTSFIASFQGRLNELSPRGRLDALISSEKPWQGAPAFAFLSATGDLA